MINKFKTFLYIFDIIGIRPQLLVFKNKIYKTIFSSLISLLIILFSIVYALFSLIDYLKYERPIAVYSKNNDENTERIIYLKDTLLMFQIVEAITMNNIDSSIAYYEANYTKAYHNGTGESTLLNIEKCKLGRNIDSKYEHFIKDKKIFNRKIEEFYCFSSNNENLSLFYSPNTGYSVIDLHIILKNNSGYTPEKLQSLIVSENDLINHNDKDNPISKSYIYSITSSFSSLEYTLVNYNFQYIKYESDDGLFFPNSKTFDGKSFSDMNIYRNNLNNYNIYQNLKNSNISNIGNIEFGINLSYYDNYIRTYKRIQSLLAEVMSVVSLMLEIGKQLSIILFNKKMSKEIIESLLNKKELISKKNHNSISLFKNIEINKNFSERKNIKNESVYKNNINNINNINKNEEEKLNKNKSNKICRNENNNYDVRNKWIKVFEKINYLHILKSFLCFKDKRTILINLCHNAILEDMSIEKILERFFNLEKIHHFYSSEDKKIINISNNNRFKEINKYIFELDNELKKG